VLIATQLMNLLFVPWIAHAGLALSIGLGACLNAGFLYNGLRRRGIYVARSGWGIFLIRLAGALFLLAGVALWTAGHFNWLALRAHPLERIGALVLVMASCGITYFGALLAMGFRFRDFKRISV
jgi:putative peptidoglycan lipid II flippase